jgi:HSP20 family protein
MEVLKTLGDTVKQGWQDLAENWRDLISRGNSALTRFFPRSSDDADADANRAVSFPQWGVLAGEVIDHNDSIIVQLELPGVKREDCRVSFVDGYLHVEGQRLAQREYAGASYRLMQRAYGHFRRTVLLPPEADLDSAHAMLRDGVLKVELKKNPRMAAQRHQVEVH